MDRVTFAFLGLFSEPKIMDSIDRTDFFQTKNKCVLNDSEWLEAHFKQIFENNGNNFFKKSTCPGL